MTRQRTLLLLVVAASLTACVVGPDYHPPTTTVVRADTESPPVQIPTDAEWWRQFDDPLLLTIVDRVSRENLDLMRASARIEQARAQAQRAGALLLPELDSAASATSIRQSAESPIGRIENALRAPRGFNDYNVGVSASWELDLFGANRRGREAAIAMLQAAELDHAAARVSVVAEAADAYLALRGLQAEVGIAEEQVETQSKLVELTRLRFIQGVAAEREVNRALAELEKVRTSVPGLRSAITAQADRLDNLMGVQAGTYRPELERPWKQPALPALAAWSLPADLIRRRPDIAVAERRLAAANAQIGSAIAAYYPSVMLGGVAGYESLDAGRFVTASAFEASGIFGLRWRLFDFGRVDAEVAGARGGEAEALLVYRASVLRATTDVEDALTRFVQSQAEADATGRQVEALRKARDQAQAAYESGVVALIDVLDSDRELYSALDRLAIAQSSQRRAAVASFRSLGGGWIEKAAPSSGL